MPTRLDLSGLDHVRAKLQKIADPDATDLMISWMKIIDDDNRKGVLAGLDKDGVPMVPVTYRPKLTAAQYSKAKWWKAPTGQMHFGLRPNRSQRSGATAGARKGRYLPNSMAGGNYGNLTSSEYRTLGGPPLAPRDQFSRVITNLHTTYARTGPLDMNWLAFGYWEEVVDTNGQPFLRYHFDGANGGGRRHNVFLPRRDLRGVRPEGVEKARAALRNWARLLIRQAA
jgi:hypothetical protein